MPRYEYKVVPAPAKGLKAKGVRKAEDRFSYALQELMNNLSSEGWEYQRAETLPSIERSGLTSTTTEWRNVMVFRRPRAGDVEDFKPELLPAPEKVAQGAVEPPKEPPVSKPKEVVKEVPEPAPKSNIQDAFDNGVEETRTSRGLSAVEALAASRNAAKPEP